MAGQRQGLCGGRSDSRQTHQEPCSYPPFPIPFQSDKYLLWGFILREEREKLPLVRFNGDKCRFTLISMNNAMIKDVDGKLQKDKSSERKTSGVLPEEATHFSDAADKIVWTKFGEKLKDRGGCFVPARVGN